MDGQRVGGLRAVPSKLGSMVRSIVVYRVGVRVLGSIHELWVGHPGVWRGVVDGLTRGVGVVGWTSVGGWDRPVRGKALKMRQAFRYRTAGEGSRILGIDVVQGMVTFWQAVPVPVHPKRLRSILSRGVGLLRKHVGHLDPARRGRGVRAEPVRPVLVPGQITPLCL